MRFPTFDRICSTQTSGSFSHFVVIARSFKCPDSPNRRTVVDFSLSGSSETLST